MTAHSEMTLAFDRVVGGVKAAPVPLTPNIAAAIYEDAAVELREALEALADQAGLAFRGPIDGVDHKAVIEAAERADRAARLLVNSAGPR